MIRLFLSLLCIASSLNGQVDLWDLPPLRYSDSASVDRVANLASDWQSGKKKLVGTSELERVKEVLEALNVPESSQILVYSKTSKQNNLIHPRTPRALYFSMNCYVGFVPGGTIEVIIDSPNLGPVFYLIHPGNPTRVPKVERDTSECLSCHGTGRTENVPGVLVRSVIPDENGNSLLAYGSTLVSHETPMAERWGGYYVTGKIGLPHLGNRTYSEGGSVAAALTQLDDVRGKVGADRYPCATSDLIALMVLEHQCRSHNLLTAAKINYERARFLSESIDPAGDPDQGSAGRVAEQAAQRIVSWFLFQGEADMGEDGVSGCDEFQQQFSAAIPRSHSGDSLADFHLNTRLFKNRCSYMIYSQAFRSLPQSVKARVISKLKAVFEATEMHDDYPQIKLSERRRIAAILQDTGVF